LVKNSSLGTGYIGKKHMLYESRRVRELEVNGVIVVNKPSGITSQDVVTAIRKCLQIKSVGHAGTLDPLACGVLPILVSKGTRISKYLIDHDKEYIATLRLGAQTDTGDITGQVVEEKKVPNSALDEENVKDILESFLGKQAQIPPMYSAIKVNGKKLYEYARMGEKVEVEPREIYISNIELLNLDVEAKEIQFKVGCSKGTYVRTLCEDIAKELGTVGTMSALTRTRAGEFTLEQSIELDELVKLSKDDIVNNHFVDIETAFKSTEAICLKSDNELKLFMNGMMLIRKKANNVYRIYDKDDKFIGLGIVQNNILKRDVVL